MHLNPPLDTLSTALKFKGEFRVSDLSLATLNHMLKNGVPGNKSLVDVKVKARKLERILFFFFLCKDCGQQCKMFLNIL